MGFIDVVEVVQLDESAATVLEFLAVPRRIDELIDLVAARYATSVATVETDIDALVADLVARGIVVGAP